MVRFYGCPPGAMRLARAHRRGRRRPSQGRLGHAPATSAGGPEAAETVAQAVKQAHESWLSYRDGVAGPWASTPDGLGGRPSEISSRALPNSDVHSTIYGAFPVVYGPLNARTTGPAPRPTLRWVATLGLVVAIPGCPWRAGQREAHRSRKAHESGLGRGQRTCRPTDFLGASPRPPCAPNSATSSPTRRKRFAWPRWRSRRSSRPRCRFSSRSAVDARRRSRWWSLPERACISKTATLFPHRMYGVGQTTFPPGDMVGMAARDWTAPGPGKYEIRDELSPSIRTWVVVESNVAAIAYPSQQTGVFVIPQLPPGEYTLRAFFSGNPVGTPKTFVLGGANVDVAIPVVEGRSTRTSPTPGRKTKHAALALLVRRDGRRPRRGDVRALPVDQHVRSRQRPRDGRGARRRQPGRRLVPSRRCAQTSDLAHRARARRRHSHPSRQVERLAREDPERLQREGAHRIEEAVQRHPGRAEVRRHVRGRPGRTRRRASGLRSGERHRQFRARRLPRRRRRASRLDSR